MAGKAALRVRHSSSRSASSPATRMSRPPWRSQIATSSSKRASHSARGPSSSTSSAAWQSSGKPAPDICSEHSMASASIISIAPGTTPAATIADTVSPASAIESKKAANVSHGLRAWAPPAG